MRFVDHSDPDFESTRLESERRAATPHRHLLARPTTRSGTSTGGIRRSTCPNVCSPVAGGVAVAGGGPASWRGSAGGGRRSTRVPIPVPPPPRGCGRRRCAGPGRVGRRRPAHRGLRGDPRGHRPAQRGVRGRAGRGQCHRGPGPHRHRHEAHDPRPGAAVAAPAPPPVPAPPPPASGPDPPGPPGRHPLRDRRPLLGRRRPGGPAERDHRPPRRPGRAQAAPARGLPRRSRSHLVAPGETLSGLASRYGVSSAAIARANGLASARSLQAGARVAIPPAGTPAPAPTPLHQRRLRPLHRRRPSPRRRHPRPPPRPRRRHHRRPRRSRWRRPGHPRPRRLLLRPRPRRSPRPWTRPAFPTACACRRSAWR